MYNKDDIYFDNNDLTDFSANVLFTRTSTTTIATNATRTDNIEGLSNYKEISFRHPFKGHVTVPKSILDIGCTVVFPFYANNAFYEDTMFIKSVGDDITYTGYIERVTGSDANISILGNVYLPNVVYGIGFEKQ